MTSDEKVRRGQAVEYLMSEEGWFYIDEYLENELDNAKEKLVYGEFENLEERNAVHRNVEFIETFFNKLGKWVDLKNDLVAKKLEDNI